METFSIVKVNKLKYIFQEIVHLQSLLSLRCIIANNQIQHIFKYIHYYQSLFNNQLLSALLLGYITPNSTTSYPSPSLYTYTFSVYVHFII